MPRVTYFPPSETLLLEIAEITEAEILLRVKGVGLSVDTPFAIEVKDPAGEVAIMNGELTDQEALLSVPRAIDGSYRFAGLSHPSNLIKT